MKHSTSRTLRNGLLILMAAVAMTCMAGSANAQSCGGYGGGYGHRGGGYGNGGYGNGGYGHGGYGQVGYGHGGYGVGYGSGISINLYRPAPIWHDTTHLDYHRSRLVPHGDHYDYIPGHYQLHRTGHWHR